MSTGPCDRTLLAAAPGARVEACTCGLIHLSVGAVTLRLAPDACEQLTTVLARGVLERRRLMARPTLSLVETQPC